MRSPGFCLTEKGAVDSFTKEWRSYAVFRAFTGLTGIFKYTLSTNFKHFFALFCPTFALCDIL